MDVPTTRSSPARWQAQLSQWLRRDGWIIALYVIATIIMTYPVGFRLGGDWIALRDNDTYMKLWDQWYFGNALSAGQSVNFTQQLFYPVGVDLTYHSVSWSVVTLIWLLTPLFSMIGAYNFSILFAVFTTAYSGYLLINSLVKHRAAAWLGGAVYSFIPNHISHAGGHPDLIHLAMIPIAVLFCLHAFSRYSVKHAIGAAAMLGLAAWTSLYIMVFALLTLIPIGIYLILEQQRWRSAKFWKMVIIFGVASILTVGSRLWPIFQSPQTLSQAIENKYSADVDQADLLSFVLPSPFNPIFHPLVSPITDRGNWRSTMNGRWPAYLGFIPFGLCLLALSQKKQRVLIWMWLSMAILFIVLCLGPVLRFNGTVYYDIELPSVYLQWFPPIRAVRPVFFLAGLSLPLAVCAAFGLHRWLTALADRRRAQSLLIILTCGLLLFEYWNGKFPGVSAAVSPFYNQFTDQPLGQSAIIDLPMGREVSKKYIYYQTIHHQPIVEGLVARTPPEAYTYIDNNPLLSHWKNKTPLDCQELNAATIKQSLNQLAANNFRYVIVHFNTGVGTGVFSDYLTSTQIYADNSIAVYAITDLQAQPPCESP